MWLGWAPGASASVLCAGEIARDIAAEGVAKVAEGSAEIGAASVVEEVADEIIEESEDEAN